MGKERASRPQGEGWRDGQGLRVGVGRVESRREAASHGEVAEQKAQQEARVCGERGRELEG